MTAHALSLDTAPLTLPSGITFLSTPYSKCLDIDRAFQQAARIAAHLSLAGITIFSPIAHSHPLVRAAGLDHRNPAVFAALNARMLDVCSTLIVVQMEGWQESDGVREEIESFEKMHKPIFDCDPHTLVMGRRQKLFGTSPASASGPITTGDQGPSFVDGFR